MISASLIAMECWSAWSSRFLNVVIVLVPAVASLGKNLGFFTVSHCANAECKAGTHFP